MTNLVSIITPCCNAEKHLVQTIESVLAQTWQVWEMLIVDDCSSDDSSYVIQEYAKKDSRIKYFRTPKPSGSPAVPRNIGIEYAKGRYIAFLDSDDMWLPNKLEVQMQVFQNNEDAAIVFSYYEKVPENGIRSGRVIVSPHKITYNDLLYGNVIGCLTGVYDTEKVGKVYMKQIGHEDYPMWLKILKSGYIGVNTCDVHALYRVRERSVSADKFKAAQWQWNIYRNVEKLGFLKSVRCFIAYAFKGFVKSLK